MFNSLFNKRRPGHLDIDPEEIFMDSVNTPVYDRLRSEGRIERPIRERVFVAWSVVVALGLLVVTLRVFHLQFFRGDELRAAAQKNVSYTIFSAPPRGIIYDRNGKPLASNSVSFSLLFKKDLLTGEDQFHEALGRAASLLALSAEQLWSRQVGKDGESLPPHGVSSSEVWPDEVVLLEDVPRDLLIRVAARPADFPGLSIDEQVIRAYPLGSAASHIVGFIGRPTSEDQKRWGLYKGGVSIIGKSGLELLNEGRLRGEPGRKVIEIDAGGSILRERFIENSKPGQSIMLNVDADLQRSVYETLARVIPSIGKKAGAAVVSDPRSGRILALASFPGFDSEMLSAGKDRGGIRRILQGPGKALFNRAISGNYPPGSTVKPLLAAGALEEGIIEPERSIYDEGFISVPNPYDPSKESIFRDWAPLGWVDMRRAIAFSANVYFYTIGGGHGGVSGLGIERIRSILSAFGFGSRLGIDLLGENAGLVPGPEEKKITRPDDPFWRIGDTYITSIGQGDTGATPLQVNFATLAVANGGTLFRPFLTKAVLDERGNVVEEIRPQVIREGILSAESIRVAQEGMRLAVTEGSARSLADFPLNVAGKTGTAQTGVVGKNHGWFTAYAPYENPEVVITVLVEDGTGGSTDAVPIAKEIFWAWLSTRNTGASGNSQP